MIQPSDQTNLQTDAYRVSQPTTPSAKSGLNMNQKKVLGIAAATVLLGGTIGGIALGWPKDPKDTPEGPMPGGKNQPQVNLPDHIDVAGKVTDNMSFEQAFGVARDEVGIGGGVFSWHGSWYNTFEKEEWSSLSLQQRQEYTEQITGEKLPVKPYEPQIVHTAGAVSTPTAETEPTIIEGYLNGQRIMGLDFDQDGIIDTLVLDGADGNTYRVVDATGNDGLDTVYRYDSLNGELTAAIRLDQPFVLTNDDFSQELETSMSKEVVDSILEPDASASTAPAEEDVVDEPEQDTTHHLANSYEADDDTYINNGDVQDMDE